MSRSSRPGGLRTCGAGWGDEFLADPGALDLVAFRRLVEAARSALAGGDREAGLDRYVGGTGLWRGPAGDGQAHTLTPESRFRRPERRVPGCASGAGGGEACGVCGPGATGASALRLAASMAPLHEPIQAGLVVALAAAGQRARALSWFGTVRSRLAEDLGIDPGPELQAAHRQVLTQPPSEPEPGRVQRS